MVAGALFRERLGHVGVFDDGAAPVGQHEVAQLVLRAELGHDFRRNLRPRLKEINTPALVVAGTEDHFLDSVAAAKVMAAGLPRARLKLLEGTGHVALLSERVRVRDWLAEFDGL